MEAVIHKVASLKLDLTDRFSPVTSTGRCNTWTLSIERRMLQMKRRARIYYSAEQKNLMWDRWQAGDSLHEIARFLIEDTHRANIPARDANQGAQTLPARYGRCTSRVSEASG
jgi:hypothetical protein